VAKWFHVTSSRNRASIRQHGLDWRRMGAAPGIAGSAAPEQQGCFLCRESDIDWFVSMNSTGTTVDVWALSGVDEEALIQSPEGYDYLPAPVPAERLTLARADAAPENVEPDDDGGDGPLGDMRVTFRTSDGRSTT
jgi:hypothetical protein